MSNFQRTKVSTLALLLLIPGLALGPIGCGPEVIPTIIVLATTAGVVAFTISQFQQIESGQLDIEMKKLRLQGIRDGIRTSVEHQLSDDGFGDQPLGQGSCQRRGHSGQPGNPTVVRAEGRPGHNAAAWPGSSSPM